MARTVTVIVPAYNAEETLGDCLEAIAASTLKPIEIILFDDGSTDNTRAMAIARGAKVLINDGAPIGPGRGRNRAAQGANGDLLMFVDTDVVIEEDTIAKLAAELDITNAAAAFGSYNDRPRATRASGFYANLRHYFVHQRGDRDATTFWSGIGMIERRIFLSMGGFDESFTKPSIEDIELGIRLHQSGERIRLVPDAQGTHCKDWSLKVLWHTDIFRRAAPWTRLIASGGSAGANLNLRRQEQMAAILACSIPFAMILSLFWPKAILGAVAAAIGYVWINLAFFGLLRRTLPLHRFLGAMLLHWCYHIYSTATFAIVTLAVRLRGRRGRLATATDATAKMGKSQITRAS